ncbi:MAG: hypothetical protein ACREUZ_22085 [Burkholderiales bacterium]
MKSPKVVELRDNDHRRQGVDAAEAPQPRHGLAIRIRLRDILQRGVELPQACLELLNRQQVIIRDPSVRRVLPGEAAEPAAMRLAPRPLHAGKVHAAAQ